MVVFKDLIQHYETEHTEKNKNFIDAEQERTSKPFPAKLQKQQGQQVLHIQGWSAQDQLCDFQQNYTKYWAIINGELIRECLANCEKCAEEKKQAFKNVPLQVKNS